MGTPTQPATGAADGGGAAGAAATGSGAGSGNVAGAGGGCGAAISGGAGVFRTTGRGCVDRGCVGAAAGGSEAIRAAISTGGAPSAAGVGGDTHRTPSAAPCSATISVSTAQSRGCMRRDAGRTE